MFDAAGTTTFATGRLAELPRSVRSSSPGALVFDFVHPEHHPGAARARGVAPRGVGPLRHLARCGPTGRGPCGPGRQRCATTPACTSAPSPWCPARPASCLALRPARAGRELRQVFDQGPSAGPSSASTVASSGPTPRSVASSASPGTSSRPRHRGDHPSRRPRRRPGAVRSTRRRRDQRKYQLEALIDVATAARSSGGSPSRWRSSTGDPLYAIGQIEDVTAAARRPAHRRPTGAADPHARGGRNGGLGDLTSPPVSAVAGQPVRRVQDRPGPAAGGDLQEFISRVRPDDVDLFLAATVAGTADGEPRVRVEFRVTKHGGQAWIPHPGGASCDADGHTTAIRGSPPTSPSSAASRHCAPRRPRSPADRRGVE